MRCTSNGSLVTARRLCTTGSPIVRLGTKWLSITSMCNQSASCSTRWASSPRWAKSAASRLGATIGAVTGSVYESGVPTAASGVADGPLSSVATPWGGTVDATLAGRGGPHGGGCPGRGRMQLTPGGGRRRPDRRLEAAGRGQGVRARGGRLSRHGRRIRLSRQLPAGRLRGVAHDPDGVRRDVLRRGGAGSRAGGGRHA